jgi:hypothetical protein
MKGDDAVRVLSPFTGNGYSQIMAIRRGVLMATNRHLLAQITGVDPGDAPWPNAPGGRGFVCKGAKTLVWDMHGAEDELRGQVWGGIDQFTPRASVEYVGYGLDYLGCIVRAFKAAWKAETGKARVRGDLALRFRMGGTLGADGKGPTIIECDAVPCFKVALMPCRVEPPAFEVNELAEACAAY